MNADMFLSSIVDIGIGIAGFAGIIAAIQHRGLSAWPAHQRILLQILFFACAMAIVFALLPSVLAEAGIRTNFIWKIGGSGLLVWYAGAVPYRIRQSRKSGIRSPMPRPLFLWVLGAALLQIYNLTTPGLAWPYLFGVFSLVVNGFAAFLLLLLGPETNGSQQSA